MSAITDAIMATGEILPIAAPAPNASWELDFYGPTVNCTIPNPQMSDLSLRNILLEFVGHDCSIMPIYLAWNENMANFSYGPFTDKTTGFGFEDNSLQKTASNASRSLSFIAMNIPPKYWSTLPSHKFKSRKERGRADIHLSSLNPGRAKPIMSQCRLYNSSYHVSFTYADGMQNIPVKTSEARPQEEVTGVSGIRLLQSDHVDIDTLSILSYQAIMDAFFNRIKAKCLIETMGTTTSLPPTFFPLCWPILLARTL